MSQGNKTQNDRERHLTSSQATAWVHTHTLQKHVHIIQKELVKPHPNLGYKGLEN